LLRQYCRSWSCVMAVLATNCQETETARRGRRPPQQSQATSILLTLSPPRKTNHATKYVRTAVVVVRPPLKTVDGPYVPLFMAKRYCKSVSRERYLPPVANIVYSWSVRPSVTRQSVSQSTYLPEITTVALQCRRWPQCTHHSRHVNIIIIYNVYATIRADFVMG